MGQQTTIENVEHLRAGVSRGDTEAFRELYDLLAEPLARFAWQVVRDRDVASDLVQTAFLQMFEKRSRVSKHLRAYAFSVVGNLARKHLRSQAVHRKWESESNHERDLSDSDTQALASQAWEALLTLPVEEREPLLLRFDHGLGVREVAVALDCPQGTAATRIRRGLERLRAKLSSNAQFSALPVAILPELLSQGNPLVPPKLTIPSWAILEVALMASAKKTSSLILSILILLLLSAGIGVATLIMTDDSAPELISGLSPNAPPLENDSGESTEDGDDAVPLESNGEAPNNDENVAVPQSEEDNGNSRSGAELELASQISGVVVDADTGIPLSGALVTPWDGQGGIVLGSGSPGETLTDAEGRFAIQPDSSEQAAGFTQVFVSARGYSRKSFKIVKGSRMTLAISRNADVMFRVSTEGSSFAPGNFWLEIDGHGEVEVDAPDGPSPGTVWISAEIPEQTASCKVCATWFGHILRSESLEVRQGNEYEVVLKLPSGSTIQVSVIGPSGKPLEGVVVAADLGSNFADDDSAAWEGIEDEEGVDEGTDGGEETMDEDSGAAREWKLYGPEADGPAHAVTNSAGVVRFENVPEYTSYDIHLAGGIGRFVVEGKHTQSGAEGDVQEVVFDLTGTGIVDCRLKVGGHEVKSIQIAPLHNGGDDLEFRFWNPISLWQHSLIYGLELGQYRVTAETGYPVDMHAETTLAVLAPPEHTIWDQDIQVRDVVIRTIGAPSNTAMRLRCFYEGSAKNSEIAGNEAGDFVIPPDDNLAAIFIEGSGYSSGVVALDASPGSVHDVRVVPSGTLKLVPDGNLARLHGTVVKSVEDAGLEFKPWADTLALPPGRYRICSGDKEPLWESVEVYVDAGLVTECKYGSEDVSYLHVASPTGSDLSAYKFRVFRDGEELPVLVCHGGRVIERDGKTRIFDCVMIRFAGNGEVTLVVSGEDIQDHKSVLTPTEKGYWDDPAECVVLDLKPRD